MKAVPYFFMAQPLIIEHVAARNKRALESTLCIYLYINILPPPTFKKSEIFVIV